MGQVAHPEKIVTNYDSSGKPMDVKRLFGAHLSSSEMEKVMDNVDKLGVATARHLFLLFSV
ncbi:hypothetical protein [Paenibacillus sp. 1A_MP2]|uniref:hypothetical protein n=1 Tax=Paenibacillus sp. 1A_MP2 TaxID=3457495 RepID=UPI003FCC4AC0